jgi:branched-chain amino acid transport system substrate-binding protein
VDSTTIAYLGEIDPGASAQSIPITNDQDVLQVSPTDTALQYTESTPAVPGAPGIYYAEGSNRATHTFARVVPSAALEAKAQIVEMKALHLSKLYVSDDGSAYGKAIALAVATDATAGGLTVKQGPATAAGVTSFGADAVFMGASDGVAAAGLFNAVGSTVKLFGPSALDSDRFATRLNPAAAPNLYVSSPGFTPKKLTPAGQKFVSDFTAAYGKAPALEAIFGYEAMASVLSVLHQAGSLANSRATVVSDFYAIKNRQSVLGTYSINGGDPTLGPFVFNHVKAGKLVPFTFTELQG